MPDPTEQLAALRRLADEATPGPWLRGTWSGQAESKCDCSRKGRLLGKRPQTDYPGAGPFHVHEEDFYEDEHLLSGPLPECIVVAGNYDYEEGGIIADADARFIAAARQAVPELLDLVASQQEAIDRLTGLVVEMHGLWHAAEDDDAGTDA